MVFEREGKLEDLVQKSNAMLKGTKVREKWNGSILSHWVVCAYVTFAPNLTRQKGVHQKKHQAEDQSEERVLLILHCCRHLHGVGPLSIH